MVARRVAFNGSLTIHESASDEDAKRIAEGHIKKSLEGPAPEKTHVDDVKVYANDCRQAEG